MKKSLKITKKISTSVVLAILLTSLITSSKSQASNCNNEIIDNDMIIENVSTENISTRSLQSNIAELGGRTYYIKNMATGQYLDVQGGVAANGTNVWQYKYNGTQSQQWYIHSYGDGTYSIYTPLGNDGTYRYALDISDGSGDNYANVQIWTPNGTDAQKFSIGRTNFDTYVLFTKCSNYDKAVVLNGPTCDQGRNVDQYTFQAHVNEACILEPVNRNIDFAIRYATTNYEQYVTAYPNLTTFAGKTADCANFVSQCLLASGIHYDGNWKIYRKNFDTNQPTNVTELDNTWEMCQPNTSPWVNAKEFGDYWRTKTKPEAYTVNYILEHPDEIFNKNYYKGDVIQIAVNRLGFLAESEHTMFITAYNSYNGNNSFALTYHSNSRINKNLLQICQEYKDNGKNPYMAFFSI